MGSRFSQQAAWILHRRPFRDTSLLLDVLTEEHGRLSLIAKGGRGGKGAGQLQAFRPLRIDFTRRGELGSLGAYESSGSPPALSGIALWSGFYVNELIQRLVSAGDGAAAELFSIYAQTLMALAVEPPAIVLRWFEYQLLEQLGYGLDHSQIQDTVSGWDWDSQRGLLPANSGVDGGALLALIEGRRDESILACRPLLARMLKLPLGERPLQTSAMLRQLNAIGQVR